MVVPFRLFLSVPSERTWNGIIFESRQHPSKAGCRSKLPANKHLIRKSRQLLSHVLLTKVGKITGPDLLRTVAAKTLACWRRNSTQAVGCFIKNGKQL